LFSTKSTTTLPHGDALVGGFLGKAHPHLLRLYSNASFLRLTTYVRRHTVQGLLVPPRGIWSRLLAPDKHAASLLRVPFISLGNINLASDSFNRGSL